MAAISACGGGGDGAAADAEDESSAQTSAKESTGGNEDSGRDAAKREKRDRSKQRSGEQESKGSGGADSPEASIQVAVSGFFTSADPAIVCEEVITMAFMKQAFGDRRGCADAQGAGSAARKVDVASIRERGKTADAVVVPKGGPNDGERLDVSLVLEGGSWRIDGIASDVPVGP